MTEREPNMGTDGGPGGERTWLESCAPLAALSLAKHRVPSRWQTPPLCLGISTAATGEFDRKWGWGGDGLAAGDMREVGGPSQAVGGGVGEHPPNRLSINFALLTWGITFDEHGEVQAIVWGRPAPWVNIPND